MNCYCGKVALYRVHTQGFCKEHRAAAVQGAVWDTQHRESFKGEIERAMDDLEQARRRADKKRPARRGAGFSPSRSKLCG